MPDDHHPADAEEQGSPILGVVDLLADAAQERAIQLRQQAVEEFTAASLAGQPFAATLSELKQGARPGSVPSSLPGHFSMPQTGKWPLLWVINCL